MDPVAESAGGCTDELVTGTGGGTGSTVASLPALQPLDATLTKVMANTQWNTFTTTPPPTSGFIASSPRREVSFESILEIGRSFPRFLARRQHRIENA